MKAALLRVGIDTGTGGIHGPLLADGSFEFIPIPDLSNCDERKYGNTIGRHGRPLVDYFPAGRQKRMAEQSMHVDPEFETFTYGDPSHLKSGLRRLESGDLLVFYSGLRLRGVPSEPALYMVGYFEVIKASRARDLSAEQLDRCFGENFHVRHKAIFADQRERLVLVKGGRGSRLLRRAHQISEIGSTRTGKPLHVISTELRATFGSFDGKLSIQRSPPRWIVIPELAARTADLVRSLD
jgi:hypothetical protein